MRTLQLDVDDDFRDAWFETEATPSERARLLAFACSLPHERREDVAAVADRLAERSAEHFDRALERHRDDLLQQLRCAEERASAAEARAAVAELTAEQHAAREASELQAKCAVLSAEKADAVQEWAGMLRASDGEVRELRGEVLALRAKVTELETPMARGRAGEWDVAQTLRDVGFEVEDTSMGDKKMQGYLDLLAWPEGRAGDGMRIAIECKNCVKIDPKTSLDTFAAKTREGIAKGLFDSSIFVSVRAHTKKPTAVALEMFQDESGRALVPVSYVGPERGKNAAPLLQEQLESHVCMHAALLSQCATIRASLGAGLTDSDVSRLQTFVDLAGEQLLGAFEDLNRQNRLVRDMQALVTSLRARCVDVFAHMWTLNSETPWLNRPLAAPWMPVYEATRAKKETMPESKDSTLWNNTSKESKLLVEKHVGHEAMFAALGKRARAEAPAAA